ncbi:TIGR04282 family arsenosugar biosynthesis glycosyltransferase [Prochlorococcus sp. AH-716-K03]|nr:TIGR04282 family arsenosugar biosynthesis glycosyltransferase [Prochlorococcus sp. AH-716-K03]
MAKWHAYGRCKTRLSKDIGKLSSSNVQRKMTEHTVSVAKSVSKKGLIDISLAISGIGLKKSKRWSNELGIKNFNLQGRGCLGERMRRQILINKKYFLTSKKNIIFIGTDLPDFCHMDLLNTLLKLKKNDLILGPSNDGGYWLMAFSARLLTTSLYLPFINIKWGKEDVLKQTINNFSSMDLKYDFLHRKIDIDTIIDIEKRE